MNKNKPISNWELLFLTPIFVLAVIGLQPVNHAHTMAWAQFRLLVDVICLPGYIIATAVRRAKQKKGAVGIAGLYGLNPNEIVTAQEYASVRADFARCFRFFYSKSPLGLAAILILPVLALVRAVIVLTNGGPASSLFTPIFLAILLPAIILIAFGSIAQRRYPSPTLPVRCWVAMTREGFTDVKPDVTSVVLWKNVRSIHQDGFDVHMFLTMDSIYFPNILRDNPEKGRLFLECARALWKGAPLPAGPLPMDSPYAQQQPPAYPPAPQYPAAPGVWPPPPSEPSSWPGQYGAQSQGGPPSWPT